MVPRRLATLAACLLLLALLPLLAWHVWHLAVHARAVLAFPFPLDYGEGPLLQQARLVLGGTPLVALYADPAQPPFAVVNYPPLYLWLSVLLARLGLEPLLAGRVLALASAFACAMAIYVLVASQRRTVWALLVGLVAGLVFLVLPVVRQWSVLMRVDLLGVALGLWGLVALRAGEAPDAQRGARTCLLTLAALLFAASLYGKPSLLAAPLAGLIWLLARQPVRAVVLVLLLALCGLVPLVWFQYASGGWFLFHVVAANANRWDAALAWQFWRDHLRLLWPLGLAAALYGLALAIHALRAPSLRLLLGGDAALPLLYALGGAATAIGVGKVGAYANYFLELDAALLWIAGTMAAGGWHVNAITSTQQTSSATAVQSSRTNQQPIISNQQPSFWQGLQPLVALGALAATLIYYYPLWDAVHPQQAGILSPNPPRRAWGNYGLAHDMRREQQILATLSGVQSALNTLVANERGPLLTDTPGLLAASGTPSILQAFEHRQLLDQELYDQGPLLRALANGEVPLAVIDFLGNWLSPEVVTLLRHRYALDGSVGLFTLYRPIAVGAAQPLDVPLGNGLRLDGYSLPSSPGSTVYHAGETLSFALHLRRVGELVPDTQLVVRIVGATGVLAERAEPLLYGTIAPRHWPEGVVMQHLAPLTLPADAAPGSYKLQALLRDAASRELGGPHSVAELEVASNGGRVVNGFFVPQPIFAAWAKLGGEGPLAGGVPVMPAVPLAHGVLQCFERVCFDYHPAGVTRRPLGDVMALDAPLWPQVAVAPSDVAPDAATGLRLAAPFLPLWEALGADMLGGPRSAPLERYGFVVQYTAFARLERAADGSLGLGRVGDDYLRRPPGVPYPWPPP